MFKLVWIFIFGALVSACVPPTDSGPIKVTEIPGPYGGKWITPESCGWATINGRSGMIVSDMGCGYEQPCKTNKDGKYGAVWFIPDGGGQPEKIASGLATPNGVAADSDGNVWSVDKGHIWVITPDGRNVRADLPNSGLLNDVTIAPWAPNTALITDSKMGGIIVAYFDGDKIELADTVYQSLGDAPNGIATSNDDNGVVVASLGDLVTPGKPGQVHKIAPNPDVYGQCGDWYGSTPTDVTPVVPYKLDGIVPFARDGVKGHVVSAIFDMATENNTTLLFWIGPDGGMEQIYDVAQHGMISAADIGVDPKTGRVCVPDLAGSGGHTTDFEAAAKVIVIEGLGSSAHKD